MQFNNLHYYIRECQFAIHKKQHLMSPNWKSVDQALPLRNAHLSVKKYFAIKIL